MSPQQRELALALSRCSFLPASPEKRFVRDMADRAGRLSCTPLPDPAPLTERQAQYLDRLAWRFRRQLPQSLVPTERPA